jgi:aldehyde:ferredoxin oxidoreductase
MGKIMRISLSDLKVRVEEMPKEYQGLGGRSLTSQMVGREVPPRADPLGDDNKLIFAAGTLAGTPIPNTGRLSVGAKSPLTNGIKEANAGGSTAQKIARLGLQAVVIEGRAKELTSLKIDKNGVTFGPASSLKGVGNYGLIEKMRNEHGNKVSIISIGPAGEMRLKAASVMTTTPDFHIRAAGRGGLGAVMGSKNLKVVVIDDAGTDPIEAKDKTKFRQALAKLSKAILADPLGPGFRDIGTPVLVMVINALACLPTKNYSLGQFDGVEKISGEYMIELMKGRLNAQPTHRCMDGCMVGCSNVYTDENGEVIVSGLEYETVVMMGSNCMIDDLDSIARMNRVCNDVGVDTMEVGGAIAVAMEAGLLGWGDGKAALSLVNEIGNGTDRGVMLGNGCKFTGEKLGVKRTPQVKGQCLTGHDPRGLKGLGVTLATSPMGPDHTAGMVLPNPRDPSYAPWSRTGQAAPSQFMQAYLAAVDSLGLCMMAGMPLREAVPQSLLISCISAFTGESLDENYLMNLGTSVLKAEKRFNNAAGFTEKDDRLPRFFQEEKLPPSGNVFDVSEEEIDSVNRF